jgi:cell division protein FtsB
MAGVGGHSFGITLTVLSGLFFVLAMIAGATWAWPWIKRVRIGLAPPDAELKKLRRENEELNANKAALEKELEEAQPTEGQIGKLGVVSAEDPLRTIIQQLTAERDALKEEKRQDLQDQRRKRIEDWRSAINNHEFGGYPRFASTVAYSQMKPHLRLEVVEMLEAPRTFHVGNEARGDSAYGYTLLDEVARIEKEWGLV